MTADIDSLRACARRLPRGDPVRTIVDLLPDEPKTDDLLQALRQLRRASQ